MIHNNNNNSNGDTQFIHIVFLYECKKDIHQDINSGQYLRTKFNVVNFMNVFFCVCCSIFGKIFTFEIVRPFTVQVKLN